MSDKTEGEHVERDRVSRSPDDAGSRHHHLLIVSRYQPGLYEYVRQRFAGEENVEVILDRRRGRDRRNRQEAPSVDRRSGDRRVRGYVDRALRMESVQFITISPTAGD